MQYRLGIDVGGTNTDAVILDERDAVLAQCKRPTTADVSSGIKEAVDGVLREGRVRAENIRHAMLGTTHCTNAIVERRNLCRVGIVRLGAPSGLAIPPLTDWPADILPHIGQHQHIVHGGYEYNGVPLSPPDEQEIRSALQALAKDGARTIFEKLKGEYDFIVVDSHPVLPATDSLLIGQHVDAVLLAVLRDVSQTPKVYAACQRLTSLGIRVLGAVVNGTQQDVYGNAYQYGTPAQTS